jgi:hypothetical protein
MKVLLAARRKITITAYYCKGAGAISRPCRTRTRCCLLRRLLVRYQNRCRWRDRPLGQAADLAAVKKPCLCQDADYVIHATSSKTRLTPLTGFRRRFHDCGLPLLYKLFVLIVYCVRRRILLRYKVKLPINNLLDLRVLECLHCLQLIEALRGCIELAKRPF